MKSSKTVALIAIVGCLLVSILTVLDFAALHDIRQDYVSRYILDYLRISLSSDLPDWTSTNGEWHLVSFSLYLRSMYFILNIAVLVHLYRRVTSIDKRNPLM